MDNDAARGALEWYASACENAHMKRLEPIFKGGPAAGQTLRRGETGEMGNPWLLPFPDAGTVVLRTNPRPCGRSMPGGPDLRPRSTLMALERNLNALATRGLIREVTGQGRFRV